MTTIANDTDVAALLESLQAQVAALSAKLERLEGAREVPAPPPAPAEAPSAAPQPAAPAKPEITEEELLAISAALGAYLGVRAHIKQIRLVSSRAWAQQGRVSIQASHRLHS